jgi:hypothetical protein
MSEPGGFCAGFCLSGHVAFADGPRAARDGKRIFALVSEDLTRTSEKQAKARSVFKLYFILEASGNFAASLTAALRCGAIQR